MAVSRLSADAALDRLKWSVELAGLKNGLNPTFTTPDKFVTGTIRLYWNGQRLLEGGSIDFITSESGGAGTGFDTITFIGRAPRLGYNLLADYVVDL